MGDPKASSGFVLKFTTGDPSLRCTEISEWPRNWLLWEEKRYKKNGHVEEDREEGCCVLGRQNDGPSETEERLGFLKDGG